MAPSMFAQPFGEGFTRRWLARSFGAVVNFHQASLHESRAEPAQRLGFPGARFVVDGWQSGYVGVAAQDQVSQRSAREVGCRHALPRIAVRCSDTAGCVV